MVGHDWGAPVAWAVAQMRPDKVRGVVGMSVPHRPRSSGPPVASMRRMFGDGFYMVRFQEPDAPEAELDRDRAATFRRMLSGMSGDGPGPMLVAPENGGFLDVLPDPEKLPGWLTQDDIAAYVEEYAESGFTGPVNWYRNLDRNWELTAAWHRAPIGPPALYIGGDRDGVALGARHVIDSCPTSCRTSAAPYGCPDAATGRSRSVPPRSTTRCSPSSPIFRRPGGVTHRGKMCGSR